MQNMDFGAEIDSMMLLWIIKGINLCWYFCLCTQEHCKDSSFIFSLGSVCLDIRIKGIGHNSKDPSFVVGDAYLPYFPSNPKYIFTSNRTSIHFQILSIPSCKICAHSIWGSIGESCWQIFKFSVLCLLSLFKTECWNSALKYIWCQKGQRPHVYLFFLPTEPKRRYWFLWNLVEL